MSFLIDTDTCSAHFKQKGRVTTRFLQHTGQLHVSAVTVGELYTWALRGNAPPQRLQVLLDLLGDVTVLDVTEEVAREFGGIRAGLFDAGTPAPELDLLIAATALSHNLTLVTHNTQDFANVPGLRLQDWMDP